MSVVSNPIGTTMVMPAKGRRRKRDVTAPNPFNERESITPKAATADGSTGTMTINQDVIDKVNAALAEAAKAKETSAGGGIEVETEVIEEVPGGSSSSTKSSGAKASKNSASSKDAKEALDAEIKESEDLNAQISALLASMKQKYVDAGGDPAKLTGGGCDPRRTTGSGEEDVPRRATSAGGATTRTSKGGEMIEITDEMRRDLGPLADMIMTDVTKLSGECKTKALKGLRIFCGEFINAGGSDDEIVKTVKDQLKLQRKVRSQTRKAKNDEMTDANLRAVLGDL